MSRASASRRSWCARCCARSRSCAPPACRSCWSSRTRAPRCRSPTTGMCSRPARRCSRAAPPIEYYVSNSGAKLLVLEPQFLARLPSPAPALWVTGESYPPSAEPLAPAAVGPGDTLAILYTSGTTGPAKGVTCPQAQYYWWGVNTAAILGVRADDVLCTTLPLFHINALNTFAQAALIGCTAVFEPQFSASRFWTTVHERRATVIYLLGAMVPILLAQSENPLERSHRVRVGLGPGVPAAALQTFHERTGITLLEGYGSTETNFVIATDADSARRGVM